MALYLPSKRSRRDQAYAWSHTPLARCEVRRIVGPLLSVALLASFAGAGAPTAMAYNQLYPPPPTDMQPCQNIPTSPCIKWPKTANNLSINVDVYLAAALSAEEVDLKVDVRNAFPQWNGIAARNPHLQETTSTSNEEIWVGVRGADFFGIGTYGSADIDYDPSAPWLINSVVVRFNSQILWNRTYNYDCTATQCAADARKVATHEFGHAEGLGHVADPIIAIMRKGERTWHWTRVDDHNGIKAIYGAYP